MGSGGILTPVFKIGVPGLGGWVVKSLAGQCSMRAFAHQTTTSPPSACSLQHTLLLVNGPYGTTRRPRLLDLEAHILATNARKAAPNASGIRRRGHACQEQGHGPPHTTPVLLLQNRLAAAPRDASMYLKDERPAPRRGEVHQGGR